MKSQVSVLHCCLCPRLQSYGLDRLYHPEALVSRFDSDISKVISTLDRTLDDILPRLG